MTEFRVDPEDLRRLARLVEENGLSELRYEEGDLRITLRTAAAPAEADTRPAAAPPAPPPASAAEVAGGGPRLPPSAPEPHALNPPVPTVRIEAPVMGVFYRSPEPGAPPFVEVGEFVEAGQAVGLIEAMKMFSEVLTEVAGRVREAPAKNGALVQPGDTLLVLEVME